MSTEAHRARGGAPRIAAVSLALLAAVTVQAHAQNGWRENGAPLGDRPNAATAGNFAVMQIATTEPDQLMADWAKPTVGVPMSVATEVPKGKPIVTFIVFRGCRADTAGNCNVTVDYETRDPGGKPYDTTKAAEVWVGKPPPPETGLELSVAGYGLLFEEKDQAGAYHVHARITDHIAGVVLETEQVVTVTAG